MKIINYKNPVLTKQAREVSEDEFGKELDEHLSEMTTLMFHLQGVGLAGPQVGDLRRILVADLGYVEGKDYGADLIKMVNPEIVSWSEEEAKAEEGCLSYPGLAVMVNRPLAINVKFFSPFGVEENRVFQGWQARIICHEIDHLNGTTLYSRSSSFSRGRYDKRVKAMGSK